jgi:adenylate cyclase
VKKHAVRILLGLAVVLLFLGHATGFSRLAAVDALEAVAYDARLLLTMPRGVDPRVVIVDIDEKSLTAEGRWPWRRDKVAAMVDRLFDQYGAAVVAFDVVFAERDESSGLDVLRALAQGELAGNAEFRSAVEAVAPRLETDAVMAEHLKGRPVILGYYFSGQQRDGKGLALGSIPKPVLAAGTFTGRNIAFASFPGYGGNLEVLQSAAVGAGHFTPWTDRDGVHRSVPMLAEYRGAYYEPLALAVVRLLADSPAVKPGFPPDTLFNRNYPGLEWLEVGRLRIPVDERANALVPYRGPEGSFPYVSASDVLGGKVAEATLRDRIVLVGTTAPGLQDLRSTPVAPLYPGVEIHANLIAGMLDGNIKQKPPYVLGAEVLLLAVAGLAMALVLPLLSPLRASIASAVVLAAVAGTNLLFWSEGNLVLPLASGLLMVTGIWALNMVYGYFVETRAKRQIAGRFGQYVPPEIVEELSRNAGATSMESAERELTILFSDVRSFTSISEGLDPPTLSALMNEYLTPMTRVIHATRGTIDKYMGDAIMAFWGAPLADPHHAAQAVQAGLDMQARLDEVNRAFVAKGWPRLAVGIGLNTGHVRVGNMGSEIRVAYTVMGDAVNLASRLEGLTKKYGVTMLVGEATRAAALDFVYREIDRVRVKGKDEPVAIYEPLGRQGEVDRERLARLKLFQQALKFYRAQDWDKAELQLLNLQKAEPGAGLYAAFLERIAFFRANPPGEGWDGVHDFDTK